MRNRELILEKYPDQEFLMADGFDDCILGVMERIGSEPIIVYEKEKLIRKLMEEGMTEEDALEFYYFNIVGSYVGELTPGFVELLKREDY